MIGRATRLLGTALRVRPEEGQKTALMAAYAACAIGAVVVGRSVRDALYLAHRSSHDLAGMYILSSFAIVGVSAAYARVADRVPRGRLNAATALLFAWACALAFVALRFSHFGWLYPALYIFVEVMGSLVVIQFWTLAQDLFHAREAKRLFGLIGAGGTVANVIFGLLVGRIAKALGAPSLLWLMVAQLCTCAGLALLAARHAVPAEVRIRGGARAKSLTKAGLGALVQNRHLLLIAAIAAVSAIAVTLVDFQFKTAAGSALREAELAGYFGRFYGVCGAAALAVQIWLTGRVLERHGILASLLPLPVGLALGSSFSAAVPNPGLFVTSLAKGSDTIFRYTINDASMQLLFLPLPPKQRGRAKAAIDGVLKPSAIALAGLVLYANHGSGGPARSITGVVLLLVASWIGLLFLARNEYVHSLVESLERRHLDLGSSPLATHNDATVRALRAALAADAPTALHALSLLGHVRGADFRPELRALLKHGDPRVRAAATQKLGAAGGAAEGAALSALLADDSPEVQAAAAAAVCSVLHEAAVPLVAPLLDPLHPREPAVRAAAAVSLIQSGGLDGMLAAAEPMRELLAASEPEVRAAAAEALGHLTLRGFQRPLLAFLRDPDLRVRRRAIAAAAAQRVPELVPALLEALDERETSLEALSALTAFGPGIEPALAAALADAHAPLPRRRGAALALARLSTREAAAGLVAVLGSPEPAVRKAAARGLSRLAHRHREVPVDRAHLEDAIRDELAAARAALSCLKRVGAEGAADPRTPRQLLACALLEERDSRVDQALCLLELLFGQLRLDVVAENLRSKSPAARANAIEVLDNSLPDPWKRRVLSALDESKRRADQVQPEARPVPLLLAGLLAGEAGAWVAACAARCCAVAPDEVRSTALLPTLSRALAAPWAPLREAAALAVAACADRAAAEPLLRPLATDPARAVRLAVRAALGDEPKRVTA